MQCGKCKFTFCWLCLQFWKDHGSESEHGYYECLKYEANPSSAVSEIEKRMKASQDELKKYTVYFTHFNNHDHAERICKKTLKEINLKVDYLIDSRKLLKNDVEFILEAAEQVIKCRRILKWTYVLAYSLKEGKEKTLLEFLQESLEKNTEHLHGLIEKQLNTFITYTPLNRPSSLVVPSSTSSSLPPLPPSVSTLTLTTGGVTSDRVCKVCMKTLDPLDPIYGHFCALCNYLDINHHLPFRSNDEFFTFKHQVFTYCQATSRFASGLLEGVEKGLTE